MKKNIMVFGAVIIALLMVPSVTAITMPQSNEIPKSGAVVGSCENRIDPDINITNDELQTLIDGLQYIDDPNVTALIQETINTIQEKGYVNSDDIQSIEKKLGIFPFIRSGFISAGGTGLAIWFPGMFISSMFMGFGYLGPSVVVYWRGYSDTTYPTTTTINLQTIDGDQKGFIIGFLGIIGNGVYFDFDIPIYGIMGIGVLIIVFDLSDDDQQINLQINPQNQPINQPSTKPSSQPIGQQDIQETNLLIQMMTKTTSK